MYMFLAFPGILVAMGNSNVLESERKPKEHSRLHTPYILVGRAEKVVGRISWRRNRLLHLGDFWASFRFSGKPCRVEEAGERV